MIYLSLAKTNYLKRFGSMRLEPIGSTQEEIDALEIRLNVTLAPAHREYLLWMGNDKKGIFYGENFYLDEIEPLTAYLPELLEEHSIQPPTKQFVCFYGHAGYALAWYEVPVEDGDPDIFLFAEGDELYSTPQKYGKFSEWVFDNIASTPFETTRYLEARGIPFPWQGVIKDSSNPPQEK